MNEGAMAAISAFLPALWSDLEAAGANLILVGGYALYQRQLHYERLDQAGRERAFLVPAARWPELRTTKDMDFIVPLWAMKPEVFSSMEKAFRKHGFTVMAKREYLSFERGDCHFDLMCPQPGQAEAATIKRPTRGSDRIRPKYKDVVSPDLHARLTPELLFVKHLSAEEIIVPSLGLELRLAHPLTQLIAKLVAAEDRHNGRLAEALRRGDRDAEREHRRAWDKHGNDTLRCLAMIEPGELDVMETELKSEPLQVNGPFGYQDFRQAARWEIAQLRRGDTQHDLSAWRENDLAILRDALEIIDAAIAAGPVLVGSADGR